MTGFETLAQCFGYNGSCSYTSFFLALATAWGFSMLIGYLLIAFLWVFLLRFTSGG